MNYNLNEVTVKLIFKYKTLMHKMEKPEQL